MQEEAKALRYRALGAAGNSAISRDDPEAVTKLKEDLAKREERQEAMKRANREFRKGGVEAITGISEKTRKALKKTIEGATWSGDRRPFPAYSLTNNNANIRRIKQRIKTLEAEAQQPPRKPVEGDCWKIADGGDGRIWVTFDKKPPKEVRDILRRHAFKWSPTRTAHVRQDTGNGWYAAELVEKWLWENFTSEDADAAA